MPTLHAAAQRRASFVQGENAATAAVIHWAGLTTSPVSVSAWTAADSGVAISNESTTGDHITTATLTSGSVGKTRVTNTVTMVSGEKFDRHLDIIVESNTADEPSDYTD